MLKEFRVLRCSFHDKTTILLFSLSPTRFLYWPSKNQISLRFVVLQILFLLFLLQIFLFIIIYEINDFFLISSPIVSFISQIWFLFFLLLFILFYMVFFLQFHQFWVFFLSNLIFLFLLLLMIFFYLARFF